MTASFLSFSISGYFKLVLTILLKLFGQPLLVYHHENMYDV
jgi:hypothetical protein